MRILIIAALFSLLLVACATSSSQRSTEDVYEVSLQGVATTEGTLVLSAPQKIEVDVASGATDLVVALSLQHALRDRGHDVICLIDQGGNGYSLMVRGRVVISSDKTNLGGIGGSAAQVIQREEVIQSTASEYIRFIRENNAAALRAIVTSDYLPKASRQLGQGVNLVRVGTPAIGCYTASIVIETQLPGGDHQQQELHVVTDGNLTWKIAGLKTLARWNSPSTDEKSNDRS